MSSKRDMFHMTSAQAQAGRHMWQKTSQMGRLAQSSFDAESMAPKTWIMWANNKGEEISTIECEIYVVGRHSDGTEGVAMLVGMCPKCGEHFLVREDNKQMDVEYVPYRKAPAFLKVNWKWHCQQVLGRHPRDEDRLPVISSPERWACDYCRGWCVRVTEGVAIVDMKGVTQVTVHKRAALIDKDGGSESGSVNY